MTELPMLTNARVELIHFAGLAQSAEYFMGPAFAGVVCNCRRRCLKTGDIDIPAKSQSGSSSGNDVSRVSCEKGADVLHRHHEHAFDGFHTVKRDVRCEDDVRL